MPTSASDLRSGYSAVHPSPGGNLADILLVEDDHRLAELLTDLFAQAGHTVAYCDRGDLAVSQILATKPDLVVLDLTLPGMDGLDVCRAVRAHYDGRILVLTARGDEIDEVVGLELGADDYLAKPVAPRRLMARIGALLRRNSGAALRNGPLELDPRARAARLDDQEIDLSTAEFDLLHHFIQRVGQIVSRDELYEALRGFAYDGIERSIDLRVSRVRKKLGGGSWIKTVHGVGYIMPPMS